MCIYRYILGLWAAISFCKGVTLEWPNFLQFLNFTLHWEYLPFEAIKQSLGKNLLIILSQKSEPRLPIFQDGLSPPAMVLPSQPSEAPAGLSGRGQVPRGAQSLAGRDSPKKGRCDTKPAQAGMKVHSGYLPPAANSKGVMDQSPSSVCQSRAGYFPVFFPSLPGRSKLFDSSVLCEPLNTLLLTGLTQKTKGS